MIATGWPLVLFIRFADRFGKGIRSAPRDALVADIALESKRGASFGLIRALDTLGAFVGLVIAYSVVRGGGVLLTREAYTTIVKIAIIPAILAVFVIAFLVNEPKKSSVHAKANLRGNLKTLPSKYWRYMAIVTLFYLANSSDAFLILKASRAHAGVGFVILSLIGMNIVSSLVAIPAGHLSDRIGRRKLIVSGWIVYAATYAGFALLGDRSSSTHVLLLFAFYGLFYGLSEGAEASMVADLAPANARGLGYGVFNIAIGIMSFPASLGFGLIAQKFGDAAAFSSAAIIALSAAALLTLV
jgi:MFS family permease